MSPALLARRALALLCFATALVLAVQVIHGLDRIKRLKTDRALIEDVRWGLLDPDQWVTRVSGIVERRIRTFKLTDANRPQIKAAVESVLNTVLVQAEQYLRRRNLHSGGSWMDQLKGVVQQGIQDALIDFKDLHRKVPQYADLVVDELGKPEARQAIQAQILEFIRNAADSTFAKTDRSELAAVLARHGCTEPAPCVQSVEARIERRQHTTDWRLGGLFASVGLLFLLCLTAPRLPMALGGPPAAAGFDQLKLFLLTGAILILLAGGILTPMIEIEARIQELSMQLMGEPVVFSNQVLYFQTKSVFDVVSILARTGKPDMILVGVLIVLFSVIFPALKVLATYVYYYDFRGLRHAPPVHFFALKSGKWSMADVLVIAIFMAYIGFRGLIGSQLGALGRAAQAQVLTTDGTTLAPGFFMFLAFVLSSMLLSAVLENRIGEGHST